jgi:hypothetical protein
MAATVVSETETSWISETGGTPVLLHSYGFSVSGADVRQQAFTSPNKLKLELQRKAPAQQKIRPPFQMA